jgi:hypothetical protein
MNSPVAEMFRTWVKLDFPRHHIRASSRFSKRRAFLLSKWTLLHQVTVRGLGNQKALELQLVGGLQADAHAPFEQVEQVPRDVFAPSHLALEAASALRGIQLDLDRAARRVHMGGSQE